MNSFEILTKNRNIAVIGVTDDENKYGYKIFKGHRRKACRAT